MKILVLNHNVAWRGGTFVRAFPFARELARRKHDVTLITISPSNRMVSTTYQRDGVNFVETPDLFWGSGRSGWDPWDTFVRARFAARGDWDLVHAFDSRPAVIVPALLLHRRGVPLVMDWADWWGRGGIIEERSAGASWRPFLRPVETYFEEAFRTRANATTVISAALFDRAVRLGVPRHTIAHIPQGADTDAVSPLPMTLCREAVGLPTGPFVLGHLGSISPGDSKLLFEAFAAVRRMEPDARLLLIGDHKASVPSVGGVIQTGFVPSHRLPMYLGACDVMILPLKNTIANNGRWPSKIGSYLAAGRPIVATGVGDVRGLFAQHDIGVTTDDEPVPLAEACVALWRDRDQRLASGRNARQVAESELSWGNITTRLETHYRLALNQFSGPIRNSDGPRRTARPQTTVGRP